MSDLKEENYQGRLIGYARVSTQEQNLDMQLIALKKAGCAVIFSDKGISGKVFVRKGLKEALSVLSKGDTLVIYKLDRLGRNTFELLKLQRKLEHKQVDLRSLTQNIDLSNASGKLTFTIFAALSEHESNINGERTKGGMAVRKADGVRLGRPNKLTPDDVATIQEMIDGEGLSVAAIARSFKVSPKTVKRAIDSAGSQPD
jgi:DNA invertase Pin-like site-specific DNA recombinase